MMKTVKEIIKNNFKKAYVGISAALICSIPSIAFAAGNDWGNNIKTYVKTQASAIAIVAVLIAIIPMIVKKAWALLIGTIFLSAIALYFVNNPEKLVTIGDEIYKIIFGG